MKIKRKRWVYDLTDINFIDIDHTLRTTLILKGVQESKRFERGAISLYYQGHPRLKYEIELKYHIYNHQSFQLRNHIIERMLTLDKLG